MGAVRQKPCALICSIWRSLHGREGVECLPVQPRLPLLVALGPFGAFPVGKTISSSLLPVIPRGVLRRSGYRVHRPLLARLRIVPNCTVPILWRNAKGRVKVLLNSLDSHLFRIFLPIRTRNVTAVHVFDFAHVNRFVF